MARIKAIANGQVVGAALVFTGGYNCGEFVDPPTHNGAGDDSLFLGPDKGLDSTQVVCLAQAQGVHVGSDLQTEIFVHTSDTEKRLYQLVEQGGGAASALTTLPAFAAMFDDNSDVPENDLTILAMGSLVWDPIGAALTWLWQDGSFVDPPTYIGVGDWTIQLGEGHAFADTAWFMTPNGVLVASGMIGSRISETSVTNKRIMQVQEQPVGAASIAADNSIDVLVIGRSGGRSRNRGRIAAMGCVSFLAGAPRLLFGSARVAGVVRTGGVANGDLVLSLAPDGGVDAAHSVMICTPRYILAPPGASNNTCVAQTPVSAVQRRITTLREGAGGIASALADLPFDFLIAECIP